MVQIIQIKGQGLYGTEKIYYEQKTSFSFIIFAQSLIKELTKNQSYKIILFTIEQPY
ncbi:hypothetical protein pb186bvf_018233 [Paramecium bursaria]